MAIARAVVGEPDLLLADEPTGALDSASGEAVMQLLHDLNADGATIAVITHDSEIAGALPRQVRIRDGQVVQDTRKNVHADAYADTQPLEPGGGESQCRATD